MVFPIFVKNENDISAYEHDSENKNFLKHGQMDYLYA